MIIGIDPGFSGAIAFYEKGVLLIHDMPLRKIMDRTQVDAVQFSTYIIDMKRQCRIAFAVVEDVHAMPKQGITSTFRFGYNAGILLGVLEALRVKVLRVKPNAWKPALGLSSDKGKSLALAKKLFPAYHHYFERAKDDGRAEAALLARYISDF